MIAERLDGLFGIRWAKVVIAATTVLVMLLVMVQGVSADGLGNTDVMTNQGCMTDISGVSGCTAQDTGIAAVENVTILDDGCAFVGDTVTFSARYVVETTAQNRYDLGIWFATDGDPNGDGAYTGECTVGTPAYAPDAPWLNLDGVGDPINDTCGDLTKGAHADGNIYNPIFPVMTITTVCADPDGDGNLNLPNCVSWDNNTNTTCTSPIEAIPGTPSKCKCDGSLNIGIAVPGADLNVTTTCADFSQDGPTYEYVIQVTNLGPSEAQDVRVVDQLPEGVSVVGWTSQLVTNGQAEEQPTEACSMTSANEITCDLGPSLAVDAGLSPDTYWQVTITVTNDASDGTVLANTVTASTSNVDTDLDNNTATCSTSTTAVSLSYFQANPAVGGVRFEWQTSAEVGNIGFHLYVDDGQKRVRINDAPILSQSSDPMDPVDYVFVAEGMVGDAFYIEDVDVGGRAVMHGPYELGQVYGSRVGVESIDWAQVVAAREGRPVETEAPGPRRASGSPSVVLGARPAAGGPRAALGGTGPTLNAASAIVPIDLLVNRDGIYRVTYEALRDSGFDLLGANPKMLAITNRGQKVMANVVSGGRFGPGAYIEFYGQAVDTLYTDANVYRLTVDGSLAAIVETRGPDAQLVPAASYMATVEIEENRVYDPASPSEDPWYASRLVAWGGPAARDYALNVDHYVEGAAPATLGVEMWGGTFLAQEPDHHVVVSLNGQALADEVFDGLTSNPVDVQIPEGLLRNGANTLSLSLPHDLGAKWDVVGLESYTVTYPRAFVVQGGTLSFKAAGDLFRVEGLPSQEVVVYRVTPRFKSMTNPGRAHGGLTLIQGAEVTGSPGAYAVTFTGAPELATYLVSTVDSLLEPEMRLSRGQEDITSGSAEYLMISHPDFVEALSPLVQAREAQGMTVKVVDVEDIYAQFGDSILDPNAIRAYIQHASREMGTKMVLLVGDDSYDYRGYRYADAISFIPSLYAATGPVVSHAPVDPLYADLDGDRLPDLPIGRFPVKTVAELQTLIAKTLTYETKDYGRTSVFSADAQDPSVSFAQASESLRSKLPGSWTGEQAYIDELGLDGSREALIRAMNDGVALTSYFGHSWSRAWSFENLFTVDDAAALANAGRPTVVTQWGCWNAYYAAPHYDSMSHRLLLSGDNGAAAVMGAVTLTEADSDSALGQRLVPLIAQPGKTLGQALQEAKMDLAETRPDMTDVILGWTLLGDPALVMEP